MRWLAALLFVVGLPWALIAVLGVGAPVTALVRLGNATRAENVRRLETTMSSEPTPLPSNTTGVEVVRRLESPLQMLGLACLMFIQSVAGYAIWSRWLLIAAGLRRSSRMFWSLAMIHHLFWIPFFLNAYSMKIWIIQAAVWYSIALAITCAVAAFVAGQSAATTRPRIA